MYVSDNLCFRFSSMSLNVKLLPGDISCGCYVFIQTPYCTHCSLKKPDLGYASHIIQNSCFLKLVMVEMFWMVEETVLVISSASEALLTR